MKKKATLFVFFILLALGFLYSPPADYPTPLSSSVISIRCNPDDSFTMDFAIGRSKTRTTSYYTGTGTGRVREQDANWATGHDATDGNANGYNEASSYCLVAESAGTYSIQRAFLPANTEQLPNNCDVLSATLNIYISAITDNDDDGDNFIRVVQTNQPDPTQLTNADYNNCGATDNPTAGATDLDIGDDLTATQYNVWTLNATGIGWISQTGYTLLGIREGHDVVDSAVGAGLISSITFNGNAAGSNEPYLSVVYAVPSGIRIIK